MVKSLNPVINLNLAYLYSDLMNIYGDNGNVITLQKRAQWRGINLNIKKIQIGDALKPDSIDLYFFGGGQDQAQEVVAKDLKRIAKILKKDIDRGVPLLSICGGYQLLGEYYQPLDGSKIEGLGIFPAYTTASETRMIGNVVIKLSAISYQLSANQESDDRRLKSEDHLVGFENHSGKTYLKPGAKALGRVIKGYGNNGEDKTEGCLYKHAIGCYMHGSLLPKNPHLADWLLSKAIEVKLGSSLVLKTLDDSLELKAHNFAVKKFS